MKDPVLIKSNKYGITVFFQQELPFAGVLLKKNEDLELLDRHRK